MSSRPTRGERKQRAAAVSVWSNLSLTVIKLAAAIVTRSVSILSEALHSGLDLVAALMAFLAIRKAREPADADHQFGHGSRACPVWPRACLSLSQSLSFSGPPWGG